MFIWCLKWVFQKINSLTTVEIKAHFDSSNVRLLNLQNMFGLQFPFCVHCHGASVLALLLLMELSS